MEILTAQGATEVLPPSIGHNNPPATPYEALKAHIDDLYDEARNFLDGEPIANEEQARAVSKILDDARKARAAADEQRKLEARPFDEGKAAVQKRWTPLTDDKKGRCALIADTCKQALAPYLLKQEQEKRAAAEAATQEAERQAAAARKASEMARSDDLADQATARILQENAAAAAKKAEQLGKQRAQVSGGSRATSLRSSWKAEITDPVLFGKWAWEHRRDEYLEFLTGLAERECRHGPKDIPGVKVNEIRNAV